MRIIEKMENTHKKKREKKVKMIRDVAIELLNLIKNNSGIAKHEIFEGQNMDIQKIIDIILSETRCSITDKQGNYSRFGSSTDIRIIKNLINIFLSDLKEIK